MAFSDLVEESKAQESELTFKGTSFNWSLDGAAIHKARAQEGIDVGKVLSDIQSAQADKDVGQIMDSVTALLWMGLEEDISLEDVRKTVAFGDLAEIKPLIEEMAERIVPEQGQELPEGEAGEEKP